MSVAVGLLGLTIWLLTLTPLSFARFELSSGSTTLSATARSRYVVTAEGPDAVSLEEMPPIVITVRASGGRPVRVSELVAEDGSLEGPTYALLGYEGRALAAFTVPQDGNYLVSVTRVGTGTPGTSGPVPGSYAVGSEAAMTWWGSWWAALVLGVVPVAAGVWLFVLGRRTARHAGADR